MELNDLNLRNPIRIGYYNPFDAYSLAKDDFETKLPLTNLHWKYHPLKPLKSIPSLSVRLIEEIPKSVPHEAVNENVYIRLMFIKIENIDIYRSQVRPLIKAWLNKLVENSHAEWAIVLLIPASGKDKGSSIIKTSSFDKLKLDFGPDGKELPSSLRDDDTDFESERIFKLKEQYDSDIQKIEAYNDFIANLKALLLKSFDRRYQLLNDQIMQHDLGQKVYSMNFRKFTLKFRLASLFNDMRLLQDSLDLYSELASDLSHLRLSYPDKFQERMIELPSDFKNYSFESSVDLKKLESNLFCHDKTPVNMLEMKILIFINQSILLQSLANSATSISISSLHISNLFQKVIFFLNDLPASFPHYNLREWSYIIIDNYLNLPICNNLIEINNQNSTENTQSYQLNEIHEFKGELRLLQRSLLQKMAKKDYILAGLLQEIPLDDEAVSDHKEESKLNITYAPLVEILSSEKTYYEHFERVTETVIQDFVAAGRSKTIDILSIDLAILNHKRGNFTEALNVLQDSYTFFIQHGWNFMGGILLEIYLDCIEHTQHDDKTHIISTCLKLFSNLINSQNNKIGINSYGSTKNKGQVLSLLHKIIKTSQSLDEEYHFPVNKLFQIKILPYINADSCQTNKNYIEIEVENFFGTEFEFQSIDLVLSSSDVAIGEEECDLVFTLPNATLSSSRGNTLKLFTNDFISGEFTFKSISFKLEDKLLLVHGQSDIEASDETTAEGNTTVIKHSQNSILSDSAVGSAPNKDSFAHFQNGFGAYTFDQKFLFNQNPQKFRCEFSNPTKIELGKSEVVLKLNNGESNAKNIKVEVTGLNHGLRLNNEIAMKGINIDELGPNATHEITIPYVYNSDIQSIYVQARISYESEGENYKHYFKQRVDRTLTISVSVQDIFKSDFVFSKFQIGTSNSRRPIRLLSNDLTTQNETYAISKPSQSSSSLVTFGEQPASFFYKVLPQKNYTIKSTDTLDLWVSYSNLHDECSAIMEQFVIDKLTENGFTDHWFLLKDHLLKYFEFDLNSYAIYGKVRISNYYENGLLAEKIIDRHIGDDQTKSRMKEFFRSLLIESNELSKSSVSAVSFVERLLYISVPVPELSVLHIVEFGYESKTQYLVGEPILVNLEVNSTTRWSTDTSSGGDLISKDGSADVQDEKEAVATGHASILAESSPHKVGNISASTRDSFQITIQNDENWLISGLKRHSFDVDSASQNNQNSYELILIPLNVGKLLLPKVAIKSVTLNPRKHLSMDINVKNGLETLLVVPELDSITFSF